MTEHPITPPRELVAMWAGFSARHHSQGSVDYVLDLATKAARWGADQELEACLGEVSFFEGRALADRVRAARRPKPLIAVAQAEALIECHEDGWCPSPAQWHVIREGLAESRRALEQLND